MTKKTRTRKREAKRTRRRFEIAGEPSLLPLDYLLWRLVLQWRLPPRSDDDGGGQGDSGHGRHAHRYAHIPATFCAANAASAHAASQATCHPLHPPPHRSPARRSAPSPSLSLRRERATLNGREREMAWRRGLPLSSSFCFASCFL